MTSAVPIPICILAFLVLPSRQKHQTFWVGISQRALPWIPSLLLSPLTATSDGLLLPIIMAVRLLSREGGDALIPTAFPIP